MNKNNSKGMNKIIFGSLIVAVVMLVGAVVILSGEDASVPEDQITANTGLRETENERAPELLDEAGSYQEYSEEALASTKDTKQVVFFHAPWCSTCKAFEEDILAQGVPAGITILKADYDNDTDLRQRYGVRLQSTFVLLDANGEVEQTWPFGQGLSNDIANLYDQVSGS